MANVKHLPVPGHHARLVMRTQVRRFVCAMGLLLSAANAALAQQWIAINDVSLEVKAGSALDFSALANPAPAGSSGWAVVLPGGSIGFEQKRTPQRFLAASFAFSPASGGFPSRAEADRIVTQLQRTGYNAVRFQNVDADLMSGRSADFDFNADQLDRFDYLFSRLKAAGLYVVMDVMYNDNGGYGDVQPHRWVKKFDLRRELYVDSGARDHWLRLMKGLLARQNKYTGTTMVSDPALLSLILVNEGGLVSLIYNEDPQAYRTLRSRLVPSFTAWLKQKYRARSRLAQSWGSELAAGESIDTAVSLPMNWRSRTRRLADFLEFATYAETDLYQWMDQKVRALGYRGFTTAFNHWSSWQADTTRATLQLVDMHGYHVLPSAFVNPGSQVAQSSSIADSVRYLRDMALTRQWDKPFTVTEYGQPFWNGWRHESVAVVPAYAALQGWDLISQFGENPVVLSYDRSAPSRKAAIYPFGVGVDPVLRAGERLAALLYRRGDVMQSSMRMTTVIDTAAISQRGDGLSLWPDAVSRLALLGGIGERVAQPVPTNETVVAGAATDSKFVRDLLQLAARVGLPSDETKRLATLKSSGQLPVKNQTDPGNQVYESDTGELTLRASARQFSVNTPRTIVVTTPIGPVSAGDLTLESIGSPATVSLSTLDNSTLRNSKRMLLMVLTDARNTGMTFGDNAETRLATLGALPVRWLGTTLSLAWNGGHNDRLKAYALALNGDRRDRLDIIPTTNGWRLSIDTTRLPGGPTPYFEIVEE